MSKALEQLFSLAGKTALVTGGAKGVGAMIATALVRAGARVIAVSRSADEGAKFVDRLAGEGPVTFLAHDLSTVEGVRAAAAAVADQAPKLHIIVNNAGAFSSGPLTDVGEERWDMEMAL